MAKCGYGSRNTFQAGFSAHPYQKSSHLPVPSGAPQGGILGPILFEHTILSFADDTKFYELISNSEDAEYVQDDLDHIDTLSTTWKLKFNIRKFAHLHFDTCHVPQTDTTYHMSGMDIRLVLVYAPSKHPS